MSHESKCSPSRGALCQAEHRIPRDGGVQVFNASFFGVCTYGIRGPLKHGVRDFSCMDLTTEYVSSIVLDATAHKLRKSSYT